MRKLFTTLAAGRVIVPSMLLLSSSGQRFLIGYC
jgi:hypothetical protein